MIRVRYRLDDYFVQVIVTGHAGYAEPGHDIVCAGVSVLTNTLANLIQTWGENGIVHDWTIMPDVTNIVATTHGETKINDVLETFIQAYYQLAEQYPAFVMVEMIPEMT